MATSSRTLGARSLFNFALNALTKNSQKTTIYVPPDLRKASPAPLPHDHAHSLRYPLENLDIALGQHIANKSPGQDNEFLTNRETCISTLENGMVVASEDTNSQMSAMGMYIKAGTRYETDDEYGICVLLERLAFRATTEQTAAEVIGKLENMGAHVTTSSSRECMVYSTEVLRELLDPMLGMIADTILRPRLTPEDLITQVKRLEHETQANTQNPAILIPEILHQVAFRGSTLARSLLIPPEQLSRITLGMVENYLKTQFIGQRIVLAGASVSHDEFVELARKHFGTIAARAPSNTPITNISPIGVPPDPSTRPSYLGGIQSIPSHSGAEHAHLSIAFKCGGLDDPDFYITYTLNMLMGGGMSFSAGGPGKGMYTRLNTNVINRYGWVESCEAFICSYSDIGIFGINGTCTPRNIASMLDVICDQLINVTTHVSDEEIRRACNQTKTSIFYNLETRSVLYDDIGRHIMAFGKRFTPSELSKMIDTITPEDIRKCARQILSTPPTVVVYAPPDMLKKVPEYQSIQAYFERYVPRV